MAPEFRLSGKHLRRRRVIVFATALACCCSYFALDLSLGDLVPKGGGAALVRSFLARALSPALTYEAEFVPSGAPPLYSSALEGARQTLFFAAAAMSLALVFGMLLGLLASEAFWETVGARPRFLRKLASSVVFWTTRVSIAGLRSVHELLWAVIFLAAFGLSSFSAVLAIAIPYTGTLAKIFAEMLDEAPRDSALALQAAGAGPLSVFAVGLMPRALPDMCAYAFYRFECAVRSSAVLGFFGLPTLGYSIRASFENLHYGEVWTYLYTLLALVLVLELWSGALRRRLQT